MKRLSCVLVVSLAAAMASAPAEACRMVPEHDWSIFKNVALARVTKVVPIPVSADFLRPYQQYWWEADLVVEKTLLGRVNSHTLRIERSGVGPGSCEFDAVPKAGGLRVVYFYDDQGLRHRDTDLSNARQEDPRVEARLRQMNNH